jgi:hypothetical protein
VFGRPTRGEDASEFRAGAPKHVKCRKSCTSRALSDTFTVCSFLCKLFYSIVDYTPTVFVAQLIVE